MKKNEKKKLQELVELLRDSCKELKRQEAGAFLDLCAQIQEFTGSVYGYAEQIVGEGHELLKKLEELYKSIYLVSTGELDVKMLMDLVKELLKMAKTLQIDKIEVAFFCYKASMADCLESIYFAAKNDPSCEVHFIPIPYYDKKPDGSFDQMYFEGADCYPESYELTDWRKYDVEERRPDVIFIMNPYDDLNLVTSVHPNFYSSRLKHYTDCLIHMDYGMNLWAYTNPQEHEAELNLKGRLMPAQCNSDYVIVFRQPMADILKMTFKQNADVVQQSGMSLKTIDTKVLALGSPKFDKILSDHEDKFVLPVEWKRKIDGKKVMLLNTSLAYLLRQSAQQAAEEGNYKIEDDRYFVKLKKILEAYKDREDIMLWWRPHPLFESTLKSMRPRHYQYYRMIVKEFVESDQGIFDTTEDLHRAIFFSDGMLSDMSSLIWLYMATGKPFTIIEDAKKLGWKQEWRIQKGPIFGYPLQRRIARMRRMIGPNKIEMAYDMDWGIFTEYDSWNMESYSDFEKRFIHLIVNSETYAAFSEYRKLQLQIFRENIPHSNGTAGQKIYDFAKQKALENLEK